MTRNKRMINFKLHNCQMTIKQKLQSANNSGLRFSHKTKENR